MLVNRAALGLSFCLLTGCFSDDRPLNDVPSAGSAGTGGTAGASSAGTGGSSGGGSSGTGGSAIAGEGGAETAGSGGGAGTSNAGSGGSNAGNGGSSGGSGGANAGSGNAGAGEGGAMTVPVGALCNSSDGEGCGAEQFCIDAVNDGCFPDDEPTCAGFCAEPAPRAGLITTCDGGGCPDGFSCVGDPLDPSRSFCTGTLACDAASACPEGFVCGEDGVCAPDKVACTGTVSCPINPGVCPPGYTHSVYDDCFGPCIPLETCSCATDLDCTEKGASCDRVAGRCVIPKSPEPRCALPFETGDCLAAMPVFAFVDGSCQPQTYGGCGGNDNRFQSLEECRARCEGAPNPGGCPEGTVLERVCLACGPTDACIHQQTLCAETCDENTECSSPYLWCAEDNLCRGICG